MACNLREPEMREKKLHLESLRGLAALSVVFFHFNIGSIFNVGFTDNAWIMVDLFFVLSGYVIALNYYDRIRTAGDLLGFQLKRFARLFPLHIVVLLLFLGLETAKYVAYVNGFGITTPPFQNKYTLDTLPANFFLLQNFLNDDLSWNYPSWSISAEFYTYLLFAAWLLVARRFRILGWILLAAVMATSALNVYQNGLDETAHGYFRCFLSFFLGFLLFRLEARTEIRFGALAPLALLVLTFAAVSWADAAPKDVWLLFPILFALLLFTLNRAETDTPVMRVMNSRALVYLGAISYGVYMIHALVWRVFGIGAKILFGVPSAEAADGRLTLDFGDNALLLAAIHLFGLLAIIGLAHLSYRFIELPGKDWLLGKRGAGARRRAEGGSPAADALRRRLSPGKGA